MSAYIHQNIHTLLFVTPKAGHNPMSIQSKLWHGHKMEYNAAMKKQTTDIM